MTPKSLLVLGNNYDAPDHAILFPLLAARDVEAVRVHPNELTTLINSDRISFEQHGTPLEPDVVLGWVYEDILYRGMSQLEAFERSGRVVVNTARTLFCGQNKYLNSVMLQAAQVPHIPVMSGSDERAIRSWAQQYGYPLVYKPIVGFGGNGLVRLESESDLNDLLVRLGAEGEHAYVQPYVRKPDRDIRVLCVNYQAVTAFYRYSAPQQWITNTIAGGRPEPTELTPELASIAQAASRAVGARVSGVDVTEDLDAGDYRIFEVNTCPSSEPNFSIMQRPPVALHALADFLAALAHGGAAQLDEWRYGEGSIVPEGSGPAATA